MNLVPVTNPSQSRLILLAPAGASVPETFRAVEWNVQYHTEVIAGIQRLRGETYLEDGAIGTNELEADGRYAQDIDEQAWHLVSLNGRGKVCGCARYVAHSRFTPFSEMGVSQAPLAWSPQWSSFLRSAVQSDVELAGKRGVDYVEVGGWALTPELRCTSEALRIALGMFSVARLMGGCIGITTATQRHCSSSILRRIGGSSLTTKGVEIPGYFDPRYDCQMELLRFDSSRPNPRFERWIEELRRYLSSVPVLGSVPTDAGSHRTTRRRSPEMTAA